MPANVALATAPFSPPRLPPAHPPRWCRCMRLFALRGGGRRARAGGRRVGGTVSPTHAPRIGARPSPHTHPSNRRSQRVLGAARVVERDVDGAHGVWGGSCAGHRKKRREEKKSECRVFHSRFSRAASRTRPPSHAPCLCVGSRAPPTRTPLAFRGAGAPLSFSGSVTQACAHCERAHPSPRRPSPPSPRNAAP